MKPMLIGCVCVLVACGSDALRGVEDRVAPAPPAATGATLHRIDLRMKGLRNLVDASVRVASVEVRAGSKELKVLPGEGGIDLSRSDHASLLGAIEVTNDVGALDVTVRLAREASSIHGDTIADGPPIRFSANTRQAIARGKLVLGLDVGRSLVAHGDGAMLLPHFELLY